MSYVTDSVLKNTLIRLRDEVLSMDEKLVEYTVIIDQENENTKTACTYADDALGMTKGASAWDSAPIFNAIKPCVFANGQVVYYLNPNNWNKKIDGTNAVLTGEDGDVMIEFPKFAYRIYTDSNNKLYVSITNDATKIAADERYTYDAFSRLEEGDLNHFYKGAYKGYIDANNKLRSIAGVVPSNTKTISEFRTAAQANGSHYQQSTYAHLKAIQCLYLIKYGDRDGQSALGFGNVSNTASLYTGYNCLSTETLDTSTSTAAMGMCFGNVEDKTKHMRVFGIEDFWGNIMEFVDGASTDSSRNIIVSWNSYSNEGITATTTSTASGFSKNGGGYFKYVQGDTVNGFLPKSDMTGSSSTHWADFANVNSSRFLFFGGAWTSDLIAGPFFAYLATPAALANAGVGGRVDFS